MIGLSLTARYVRGNRDMADERESAAASEMEDSEFA